MKRSARGEFDLEFFKQAAGEERYGICFCRLKSSGRKSRIAMRNVPIVMRISRQDHSPSHDRFKARLRWCASPYSSKQLEGKRSFWIGHRQLHHAHVLDSSGSIKGELLSSLRAGTFPAKKEK